MTLPNFNSPKKKNKKQKILIAFFFVVIILVGINLYAIKSHYDKSASFFANFTSKENTEKIQNKKMMAIQKAATGLFSHMRFTDTRLDMKNFSFKDIQGKDHTLADFIGKPILINLWAIWCTPCRIEMPELAQLKRELGGENFDVIAINIDKTASPEKIQRFLQDIHADNLVYYRDETMNIFNDMRKQGLALGLPITLLIDKNGYLIASYNGSAPWANDDAKALIKAVMQEAQ
ncbi:thiol-disulfide isomerase/thioredoxin [Bartonella fuyuanensis]|uniref:Thiol-disulfide isomerase/thioredoxin n=1 Tax=Bartonella fuyuanensis TaxID=1460968 RepID=A0A840DVY5_9HYPH|nr:TlpA disulfide reductase family protein [Bartonella fuyuanensis]MBB4075833.1 thiol-disulfide isomerase/thioredoxin [Bartonella fuyuanensis]